MTSSRGSSATRPANLSLLVQHSGRIFFANDALASNCVVATTQEMNLIAKVQSARRKTGDRRLRTANIQYEKEKKREAKTIHTTKRIQQAIDVAAAWEIVRMCGRVKKKKHT